MPPNILLLMSDQQSRFAQSAAGNTWAHTPHLDALSASGVRFTRAYCAAPVCSPSRCSLATGRPSHQTGLVVNGFPWPAAMPEMCGTFLNAGYDVGWAGTWLPRILPRGADVGPRFEHLQPEGLAAHLGLECDALLADAAIDYLRRASDRDHGRPFFLGVPLVNPHDICYWVMNRLESTAPEDGELPPLPDNFAPLDPEPEFIGRCRARTWYGQENTYTAEWDETYWRRYLHEYYALTERVDGEIGRLLAALHDAGLERDTLVVYTSDHGEGMAAHRWVVKLMLWESVVSVPLSISWPGVIAEGETRDHLTTGTDVLPTLCDYAGLTVPEGVTGTSLRGAIDGTAAGNRQYVVSELHPDTEDLDFAARIVVSARHKYVAFSEGVPRELLFDLHYDPGETCDLAGDPACISTLAEHRHWLGEWIADTDDPFAPPSPESQAWHWPRGTHT